MPLYSSIYFIVKYVLEQNDMMSFVTNICLLFLLCTKNKGGVMQLSKNKLLLIKQAPSRFKWNGRTTNIASIFQQKERTMDYKKDLEQAESLFNLLLPYVKCTKEEFMSKATADAKLALFINGWINPFQACNDLLNQACWLQQKGKLRSKVGTQLAHNLTKAISMCE